jgi:predicted deacylase
MKELPNVVTLGIGEPKVGIVACVHGNEQVGKKIIDDLAKDLEPDKGSVRLIEANPEAVAQNVRYVESDLNKSFRKKSAKTLEDRIAENLKRYLDGCKYVLDFHTNSCCDIPFAISTAPRKEFITKSTREKASFYLSVENLVHMSDELKSGGSLIDYVDGSEGIGFSIELGKHDSREAFLTGIRLSYNFLRYTGIIDGKYSDSKLDEYEAREVLRKPSREFKEIDLPNFEVVRKGSTIGKSEYTELVAMKSFYPILAGEKAYESEGIICIMGQRTCEKREIPYDYHFNFGAWDNA